MENSIIQTIYKWNFNILIILCMYTTIFWISFATNTKRLNNNFFNLLLRLEIITVFGWILSGLILLILEPAWFDSSSIIVNIILAFITGILIILSSLKTKHYIYNNNANRMLINILRIFSILFLMTVYTFGAMVLSKMKYGTNIKFETHYYKQDAN